MIRVDCAGCGATLDVSRRERGKDVPCPRCRAGVAVPASLDFTSAWKSALGERRSGGCAVHLAWVAAALFCFPPLAAAVWWWASSRISRAEQEGRVPAEPLLVARVVAAVAFVSQCVFWGRVIGPHV